MIEGPLTGAADSDSASADDVIALAAVVTTNTTAISLKAQAADLAVATTAISTHSGEIGAIQTSINGLANSFYTKPLTDGLLSAKQDVIAAGGLSIDQVSSLQATLDAKQAALSNNGGAGITLLNGVEIRQVQALAPLSAAILYDFGNPGAPNNNNLELSVDLSGKEDLITDGSLSIARTNGLQSAIDGKQANIATATFAPSLTTFSTPVSCNFDFGCVDLTCAAIYGGAVGQIAAAITSGIAGQGLKTPSWGRFIRRSCTLRTLTARPTSP